MKALFRKKAVFTFKSFTPFSTQTETIYNDPNNKSEKPDENVLSLSEYRDAMQSFYTEKYGKSDELFKRVLKILEGCAQNNSDSYMHVLKKLVINSNHLKLYSQSEKYLERIIEVQRERKSDELIVLNDFNNLVLHCLRTNVNKAILVSKAVLSDKSRPALPNLYDQMFSFNLGTGYLLKGNYPDAKSRLRYSLSLLPSPLRRGYALNNLALASWWHKTPTGDVKSEEDPNTVYTLSQIDNDFKFVIPLLKKAIRIIEDEGGHQIEEGRKEKLERLLDVEKIAPKQMETELLLARKEGGKAVMNIGEYLFLNFPEKRNEAAFWFKYALKFFEKHDPKNIDRCLIFLALFCKSSSQFIKAEGLFRKAQEMLEDSDSYNKGFCMNLYGKMLLELPNRQNEGEEMIKQSQEFVGKLPYWSDKLINVYIPELDL